MNNAVLFVVGKTYICNRIKDYTRQEGIEKANTASHVAYKFWYDSKIKSHKVMSSFVKTGWYVIESHFVAGGVGVYEYDYWLKMNKGSDINEVVDNSFDLDIMLNMVGEHYAIKDLLKLRLETDLMFWNKNIFLKVLGIPVILSLKVIQGLVDVDNQGIYCSELLLKANDIIAKEIGKKPYESWPSDLQKYYKDFV